MRRSPGLLYLGTENAIYVSFDDGGSWTSLQSNLPHAPVHWLEIQPRFNDHAVATYGRGFWILDDVTPLQQLTAEVASSDVHLFAPRDAYRFQFVEGPMSQRGDTAVGENPPYGASINYYRCFRHQLLGRLSRQGQVNERFGWRPTCGGKRHRVGLY